MTPCRLRCPAIKEPPLTACNIWASDFAATGIQAPCNATAILDFVSTPGAAPTTSGGVLVKYADGRESLAFLFDCAGWSQSCLVLGHLSLSWMLRDIIPGARQPLLLVQMDDVLLTTGVWACQA